MPHPHAENMRLYAEDAAEIDKPWERWEFSFMSDPWKQCIQHPNWQGITEYRRKPRTRTYTVTVPEPLKEWQDGCWTFNLYYVYRVILNVNFDTGIYWATEAEAQAAFDALFGPLKEKAE